MPMLDTHRSFTQPSLALYDACVALIHSPHHADSNSACRLLLACLVRPWWYILFFCATHVANIHFRTLLATPPFMWHHWMQNHICNLMVYWACSQHAWFKSCKWKCHEMKILCVNHVIYIHFWDSLAAPTCMWHHWMQNHICNLMVYWACSQHAWFKNGMGKCCSPNCNFVHFQHLYSWR